MMRYLNRGMLIMLAPDGAGSGSAEGGAPAPVNAEESLRNAFGANADAAGADGKKPDAKPAVNTAGDNAAGGNKPESETKLAAWTEQLPADMRSNADTVAKLSKYQKVGDLAKALLELETKTATAGVPGKDATVEEVAAFWEKAGRPKKADGYSFAKEEGGAEIAAIAFNANLTQTQADSLFKNFAVLGEKKIEAAQLAQTKQLNETAAALSAEYGAKFNEKMELLTRGLANAGPNVAQLLRQAGLAGNLEINKAFIAFGEMTAESGSHRGKGAGEPMKGILDGGSFEYK